MGIGEAAEANGCLPGIQPRYNTGLITQYFRYMAKPPAPQAETAADPVSQFEDAMRELEEIVQRMERGDLRLEESLQLFERGMTLSKTCRGSLDGAELRVRKLLEPDTEA